VGAVNVLVAILIALAAVFLILLGLVVLVAAAVLFLPVHFGGRLDARLTEGSPPPEGSFARWQANARWGWALLRVKCWGEGKELLQTEVTVLGLEIRRKAKPSPDAGPKKPKERKPRKRKPLDRELILTLFREGKRLLKRVWRSLRLRLEGNLAYGFGDPGYTGIAYGFMCAVGPSHLRLSPDYLDPKLEGWLELNGKVFGVELLAAGLALAFHPVIRRRWIKRMVPKRWRVRTQEGGRA